MDFFDSHSHYNDSRFDNDREEIIKKVYENDIKRLVIAGYGIESSKEAIKIANRYDYTYAICGISPNDIEDIELENKNGLASAIDKIRELAKDPKVVAIGEIGLDYYWNKENKEEQKKVFIRSNRISK